MAESSEKAVLAVCLRNPLVVDEATAVGLKKDHFSRAHYRLLWQAFIRDRQAGTGPDRATIYDRFEDKVGKGKPWDSWDSFGATVDDIERTPAIEKNVETYVGSIIQSARRQYIVDSCRTILACEDEKEPFSEILRVSSAITNAVTWAPEGRSEPRMAIDITRDYLDDMEAQLLGLKTSTLIETGIEHLDDILKVRPGQMVIVGGRPKMGKTHLMITVLKNVAKIHDNPTLFVSAEMNEAQIGERIATSEAKFGMSPEELRRAKGVVEREWEGVPIYFDDKPKSLGAALMSIRIQKKRMGICAAAVDYLQLLKLPQAPGGSRERQVAEASSAFKRLAMELDIPIFVVAQLNRNCEYREDKRPILSDLRDSGQLEQDADAVVFVYRHSVYKEDHEPASDAEVIVRAQRNGPTGTSFCTWEPGSGWFRSRQ